MKDGTSSAGLVNGMLLDRVVEGEGGKGYKASLISLVFTHERNWTSIPKRSISFLPSWQDFPFTLHVLDTWFQ